MHVFILTTFYNSPGPLAQCLRSLAHQSVEFTCVLVDDGSEPTAKAVAREFAADDERFVLVDRARRQGPAAARFDGMQRILELADDDDIVVLVDGDDYLIRDRALELILQRYQEEPMTRMSFGGTVRLDGWQPPKYPRWILEMGWAQHWPEWSASHPRTFRVGLYGECLSDFRLRLPSGRWLQGATDQALIFPMLARCRADQVAHIDIPLYFYRIGRADGLNLHASSRGRLEQWIGEHYARRSAAYSLYCLALHPRRTLAKLGQLGRRAFAAPAAGR